METKIDFREVTFVETPEIVLNLATNIFPHLQEDYDINRPFLGSDENCDGQISWFVPLIDKQSKAVDYVIYHSETDEYILVPCAKYLRAYTGTVVNHPDWKAQIIGYGENFSLEITKKVMDA